MMTVEPDDAELISRLEAFADWQLQVFTAGYAERMYPNYALFAQVTEGFDAQVLRMALDKVWEALAGRAKLNIDTQLERVEAQIPEVDDFDMYGVYPALHAAVALCSALYQMNEASVEEAVNVSRLSEECVATYLEITADQELSDEQLVRFINTHELMEQERDFSQQLLDTLAAMKTPQATRIDALRELAENEGVSNIGICEQE